MGKNLLGIHKGIEKKVQMDRNQRAEAFTAGCRKLTEEFGIDFCAELQFTPAGIKPVLRIADAKIGQTKEWSEAMRENLTTRNKCNHKENEAKDACKECGLESKNWDVSGLGATEEYIERTENKIIEQKAKEEKERKERETLPEETKE